MDNYIDSLLDPLHGVDSRTLPGTRVLDAIAADTNVTAAHRALLRSLATLEKALYGRTVQLLNSISVAYYEHLLGKGDAVIFGSRPNNYPPGDYLALEVKPDVCAFQGSLTDLLLALAKRNFISNQPWSTLIEVGELKRLLDAVSVGGQLKTYLASLKRYRADMTTVHGFSLARGCVQLSSLNPGGMTESQAVPWDDLSPWIAHVVQVYHSLDERDVEMEYCLAQEQFHRWDIRKSGLDLAVMPFHVGSAPGRTTFACFEIGHLPAGVPATDAQLIAELNANFDTGIVEGFWKLSWQRTTSRSTEKELLDLLHKDGWVPGLVRHYPESSLRGADSTAVFHPSGEETIGRVRDILHLGSIGQPLSQCATVGEMLDTMYDLIEVHAHICDLGVLHRDVSYFNVMCNPQHYITTHPTLGKDCVLERPCIKKIFGDKDGQPCVLLTDLDHATTFVELATGALDSQRTVGTPMFMSVYLAAPNADRLFMFKRLGVLHECLEAAEKNPELFQLAFPSGDGGFMAKFREVMAAEELRPDPPHEGEPIPQFRHDWRHDAESIYWIYVYSFARARPLDTNPEETESFTAFCRAMLMPGKGAGIPVREKWLNVGEPKQLFAVPLKPLELLFQRMASYLTIPWHIYCGDGGIMANNRDHVHVAFRRLIIWFKLDSANNDTLGIHLDTASPRITTAFDHEARQCVTPTGRRENTGAAQLSTTIETRLATIEKRRAEALAASIMDGDTRGPKRPKILTACAPVSSPAQLHTDDGPVRDIPQERGDHARGDDVQSKSEPVQQRDASALDAVQECVGVDDAGDRQRREDIQPKDKPMEPYDACVHGHAKSARALRLMFWKDRSLWFGRGK